MFQVSQSPPVCPKTSFGLCQNNENHKTCFGLCQNNENHRSHMKFACKWAFYDFGEVPMMSILTMIS